MNIRLFSALRAVNRYVKRRRRAAAGEVMSPVRRIEFVAPPRERVCAMTFDDGPTAAPCVPVSSDMASGGGRFAGAELPARSSGLTERLLDACRAVGATVTFDVIGSTAENYPDTAGALHTHFVFGTRYDHYACFGQDALAGASAQPELIKRMVREGHEIANHGYRHRIFGPEYFVYRKRVFQRDIDEVTEDLRRLHELILRLTGAEIKMARPPHYVDRIGRFGRHTAYDAFARMGYHYMAASADGGGWFPATGDYGADVRACVEPLRQLLERDAEALNGAVIFQKDGYNMSRQSPIADALPMQLKLLADFGYRVVGVSELMRLSPFEDVRADDPCLDAVRGLEARNLTLGFKNNTFQPDAPVTGEQLDAMSTPREKFTAKKITDRRALSANELQGFISKRFGRSVKTRGSTRRDAAMAIWEALR